MSFFSNGSITFAESYVPFHSWKQKQWVLKYTDAAAVISLGLYSYMNRQIIGQWVTKTAAVGIAKMLTAKVFAMPVLGFCIFGWHLALAGVIAVAAATAVHRYCHRKHADAGAGASHVYGLRSSDHNEAGDTSTSSPVIQHKDEKKSAIDPGKAAACVVGGSGLAGFGAYAIWHSPWVIFCWHVSMAAAITAFWVTVAVRTASNYCNQSCSASGEDSGFSDDEDAESDYDLDLSWDHTSDSLNQCNAIESDSDLFSFLDEPLDDEAEHLDNSVIKARLTLGS